MTAQPAIPSSRWQLLAVRLHGLRSAVSPRDTPSESGGIDPEAWPAVLVLRGTATRAEPRTREPSMKVIKSYPTRVEADLARIALEAAGVPSVVVGIGVGMEGGAAGVQLLVPDDRVEAALKVLGDT